MIAQAGLVRARLALRQSVHLRLALLGALALAGFALVVERGARLDATRARYEAGAERLAAVRAVLEGGDWGAAAERERAWRASLGRALWEAETEGVAQAKLQAALGSIFDGLEVERLDVRSAARGAVPGVPGLRRIVVWIEARYRPGVELELLHALASHPRRLVVERLSLVRHAGHGSHLSLAVAAYFEGLPAAPAPGSGHRL